MGRVRLYTASHKAQHVLTQGVLVILRNVGEWKIEATIFCNEALGFLLRPQPMN